MSDPRQTVDFSEIDAHFTSMKSVNLTKNDAPTGGAVSNLGTIVSVASNATVDAGTAGDRVFGQVAKYDAADGYVTVQDRGYVTANYSSTAPSVNASVECDGSGGVRVATSTNVGGNTQVVSVDTTKKTVTFKIS